MKSNKMIKKKKKEKDNLVIMVFFHNFTTQFYTDSMLIYSRIREIPENNVLIWKK